jgi:hypothetical protein
LCGLFSYDLFVWVGGFYFVSFDLKDKKYIFCVCAVICVCILFTMSHFLNLGGYFIVVDTIFLDCGIPGVVALAPDKLLYDFSYSLLAPIFDATVLVKSFLPCYCAAFPGDNLPL